MGRLIGYMANRTDRLAEALEAEHAALGEASSIEADAWGIGFYQNGEVLHKKRPRSALHQPLSWADLAGNVRSDCALLHFRSATVGDYRAENTHPFRLRQWLFAHTGTVSGFEPIREALLEAMPDFLRRSIRGTTDSEHVFMALMAFLHDEGQLDNPEVDSKAVLAAVRATIAQIDRLTAEIGAPPATFGFALTNGLSTFAGRRGLPMRFVEREVPSAARGTSSPLRYVMVASNGGPEPAPEWQELRDGQALVVDRTLRISLADL